MKKIRFIYIFVTAIFVLNGELNAQSIMPLDTNYWATPIHKSCIGKIISYEHLQLSHNFSVNVNYSFQNAEKMELGYFYQWSVGNKIILN